MQKHRLQIKVLGKVQGVAFRFSAKVVADSLNLCGYAENFDDGSVEIVVEGDEYALKTFSKWCTRGPLLADVRGLHIDWQDYQGAFDRFVVKRDGNIFADQFKILQRKFSKRNELIIPKHVAIICDGNRRWALERGLTTHEGHEAGYSNIEKIITTAKEFGVKNLTFWVFSTENWKRSPQEVNALMTLFERAMGEIKDSCTTNKIRFQHFGRKDRFPENLQKAVTALEESTKSFTQFQLGIALDYGGRDEIVRSIKKAVLQELDGQKVTEENFGSNLDTSLFPDPDLVIRTSGEQRLSGFMPWQTTYSELHFTDTKFPEFSQTDFLMAILDYSFRKRRFGN